MRNDDTIMHGGVVHPRHAQALDTMKAQYKNLPGDVKCIVMIYDGPNVPGWDRKLSYYADAPVEDISAICGEVVKQIR